MHVGLFHSMLPESGRKVGGVDYFVHRLGNHLVGAGHRVTVYSHTPQAPDDAIYAFQRVTRRDGLDGRFARLTAGSLALNAVDFRGVDVLSLHGDDWFFLRRQVPTVRTFYGSALREAIAARSLKRRVVQSLVFPGELVASRLSTLSYQCGPGMPRGYRLAGTLPLGTELPPAPDLQHEQRSEHPTVLFVGTWEGRKRGRELRDAFLEHVVPVHPGAELLMASDRCEVSPNVRWLGRPSDEELQAHFSSAWAFCLPSSYEGFGIPYIEAMARATPVVATPNPGSLMVSQGGTCARIVPLDEVGPALAKLLGDRCERRRLGQLGVRRAQDFSWDAVCRSHVAAFQRAIDDFAVHAGRRGRIRAVER